MPAEKIVRISDYERRSREPDAEVPRDPADADVIVYLPLPGDPRSARLREGLYKAPAR